MKFPRPVASRKRGGFTLVELLVVIGIIAILAGLLLPVLSRGMVKAKAVECLNQLRQTGIAMQSFAHEHRDRFPMQVPNAEGGSREADQEEYLQIPTLSFSARHFIAISNELGSPQLAHCPADRSHSAARTFASMTRSNVSYWVNVRAQAGNPVQALAGDWNVTNPGGSTNAELAFTPALHLNRGNVLFGDGHVELRKTVFLDNSESDLTRVQQPQRPAPDSFSGAAGLRAANPVRTEPSRKAEASGAPPSTAAGNLPDAGRSASSANPINATDANGRSAVAATESGRNAAAGGNFPLARSANRHSHEGTADASNSETNSSLRVNEIVRESRPERKNDGIPMVAMAQLGAWLLLWLLLIVVLAVIIERYIRRRLNAKARLTRDSGALPEGTE